MQVIGNRNVMDLDFCLLLFTSLFIRASIYAPQILQQLLVVHCMLYQRNKDQSWWNRENNLLCTAFSCQWLQWELSRCFLDKGCFLLQRSSSKIHSVFLQDSAHHDSAIPVNLNSWRIKKCSTALFEICHVDLVSLLLLNFILEWFTYQECIMGFCVAWDLFLEWGKDSTVTKS